MLDQRLPLVLRHQINLPNAGVHAVGEHEVDDAELAAEWSSGFAAVQREVAQPLTAPARHDDRQSSARQPTDVPS